MKTKIIYFRESLLQSILADATSFGFLLVSYYLNYRFIGGNNFVDVILFIIFFTFTLGRSTKKGREFTSYKEMLKYIFKEVEKIKE